MRNLSGLLVRDSAGTRVTLHLIPVKIAKRVQEIRHREILSGVREQFDAAAKSLTEEDRQAHYDRLTVWLEHFADEGRKETRVPPAFDILAHLMIGKQRRNDVLTDIENWYDEWSEKYGPRWAKAFCVSRLIQAILGQTLDIADRVAGILGKLRGAK